MDIPIIRKIVSRCVHFSIFIVVISPFLTPSVSSAQPTKTSQAGADSVQLVKYRALPEDVRKERSKQADDLRKSAAKENDGPGRLALLEEAVEVDPSDPWGWLDLSQTYSWMGYPTKASEALSPVRMIISDLMGKDKIEIAMEYALARAWLEYEQGNFSEGERWAGKAVKWKAGLRGYLIEGLTRSARVKSEAEMFEYLGVFRPIDNSTNRQRNVIWISKMWFHLNNIDWIPPDIWGYRELNVKIAEHEMARGRDLGLVFETNGEGVLASREYEKFLKYLPVKEEGWLHRMEAEIPDAAGGFPAMPYWVNRDDGYVTGSMLAYLAHGHRQMISESDPAQRGKWAEYIVRTGAAATPRYPRHPWIHLWRAEAFLVLDILKEAEAAITDATAWFEALDISEPALNPVLGHVLLLEKNYRDALPVLEQAAMDYPTDPSVWADLGVARVMKVGRESAREAFDHALGLDPEMGVAWHNRGLLNLQDGRNQEALADLEMAAELEPDNSQIIGDLARARQKVLSVDP
jgi:tetratricopeptide (TPR) repeat protein